MKVIEDKKEELALLLDGFDLGFANWIASKLLEDKAVEFAASDYDHPMKGNPVLRIKGSEPKKSLLKALAAAEKELNEFGKALKY